MAKKFMGRFMKMLGFEDQDPGQDDPKREDTAPYAGAQARSSQQQSWQKPPVRRRIDELPPQAAQQPGSRRFDENRVLPLASQGAPSPAAGMRMVVYQPQSYDDTQRIIDDLKSGRPVIANLEDLNVDIAQRVLDFLSGAIYGLDGSIRKISRGIFLLAPPHVDISGNALGNLTSELRAGRGSYFNLPRRPE